MHIYKASNFGYTNVTDVLIKGGANVDDRDIYGGTALLAGSCSILFN